MPNDYTLRSSRYSRGCKAHEWGYIEKCFIEHFGGKYLKIVELIKHIRQSGLSDRLYGLASMDKLVISNNELINVRFEALHIEYDLKNNTWSFIYYAKPHEDPGFVRTYDADKGIEKFDQFIEWIRW